MNISQITSRQQLTDTLGQPKGLNREPSTAATATSPTATATSQTGSGGIYRWDDFYNAANDAGLYGSFSEADLKLAQQNPDAGMNLLKYKTDWQNATTDEARALANLGAERIRSQYGGYTGGGNGGSFHLTDIAPTNFQMPDYESRNDARMQELMEAIENPQAFQYDPETDPAYQAYKKQYLREGRRATENTMAQYAAMTGGIPSSYAVSAAAQAGNDYASRLSDKVPQLMDAAYGRYRDDLSDQRANLTMRQNAEQLDRAQWESNRDFNYGKHLDQIDALTRQRNEETEKATLAAQYGDNSFLNAMGIDTSNDPAAFEKNYNLAILAAQQGDYRLLNALGIDTSNNPTDRTWASQQAQQEFENAYHLATLAAQRGNYGPLNELLKRYGSGSIGTQGAASKGTTRSGSGGSSGGTSATGSQATAQTVGIGQIQNQVLAAGQGPLSEAELLRRIASGEIRL